jgi:hypothetical protein
MNSRDFSLLARSISRPNHRICGAPKHFTDVDLTVDGPGVQFVGVPAMVDRPIHPSKVVEVYSACVGPSWTFV